MKFTTKIICMFGFLFCLLCGGIASAQQPQSTGMQGQQILPAQQAGTPLVRLISPGENTETIGEKPDIKVEFTGQPEGLLVMLDNIDVTQLVKKTENGFTYKPITNLAAGAHILKVTAKDREGKLRHLFNEKS